MSFAEKLYKPKPKSHKLEEDFIELELKLKPSWFEDMMRQNMYERHFIAGIDLESREVDNSESYGKTYYYYNLNKNSSYGFSDFLYDWDVVKELLEQRINSSEFDLGFKKLKVSIVEKENKTTKLIEHHIWIDASW